MPVMRWPPIHVPVLGQTGRCHLHLGFQEAGRSCSIYLLVGTLRDDSGCPRHTLWILRVLETSAFQIDGSTRIRPDNQSAISWVTGERFPSFRSKHIDVCVHFIRELVQTSTLDVVYLSTEDNDVAELAKLFGLWLVESINERLGHVGAIEAECWRYGRQHLP